MDAVTRTCFERVQWHYDTIDDWFTSIEGELKVLDLKLWLLAINLTVIYLQGQRGVMNE